MKPENRKHPKKKQEGKVRTKLEGMHCALMASNAEAIFNYLYCHYYEQLIPILMSEELNIFYDVSLE